MTKGITLDGYLYSGIHVASLKRFGEVLDGPNAGRPLSGGIIRDIIGTYYNYALIIDSSLSSVQEYDKFYEAITAPVDSHAAVLPYGQSVLSYEVYVSSAEDELLDGSGSENRWGNLTVKFIAAEPNRTPT